MVSPSPGQGEGWPLTLGIGRRWCLRSTLTTRGLLGLLPLLLVAGRADLDDGTVGIAADADAGEAGTDALPVHEELVERRVGTRGNSWTSHANDWSAKPPNSTPLTRDTPPTTARMRIGRPLSISKSGVDAEPR